MKKEHSNLLKGAAASILGVIALASIGIPAIRDRSPRLPTDTYVYPIMSPRLSSKFGKRKHPIYKTTKHHNGIDLAAPQSSPIRAIAAGTVVFADPHKGYGNLIVVRHDNGLTSHYGHCHEMNTQPGAIVKPGEIIGTVGKTGNVTGPHLHLEIRREGKPEDPQKYLPYLNSKAQG